MVTAKDQRELLKVSYEMGELLVSSGHGAGRDGVCGKLSDIRVDS